MPRHLISDVHEWMNEIPTVPIHYLHDIHDTGVMLNQLSCEATHVWERGQFVEFISSCAVKWCEICIVLRL